jgi:hypothetical protein
MKTTRFFIVLGACALVFTIALGSIESCVHPSWAQTPVRRADPWAGDPDSPGSPYEIPFDGLEGSLRTAVPYDLSASSTITSPRHSILRDWWARLSAVRLFPAIFRERR